MKKAIDLYKNYGIYTNTGKMLPSIIDGLLPVHRRMLLVLHTIAANSKVKTVTANGELLGKYHPHAESTGPAVWAVKNDFAVGYGQWGSDIGIESIKPSAARYTEIKASKFVEDTAMKYVKHVKWDVNELDFEEPSFLPTLFPFCLMGKGELSTIGFGVKPEIPVYSKQDLCKRLLFLLGKIPNEPVIKPNIPNCDILSSKKDLKTLLNTGSITIQIKGHYTEDKKNNLIYIHGWGPRTKFESIYKNICRYNNYELFENEAVGMLDESNAKNGTKIRFEILKQRNVSDAYDKLKEAIDASLTRNIRYAIYVVDDGKFKLSSVDEMLLRCYKFYKETYKDYCDYTINKLKNQIEECDIIKKMKPHIPSMVASKTKSVDIVIEDLSNIIKVDVNKVKSVVEKYNIKKLLSFDTDKTSFEDDVKEYTKRLINLETYVLTEYKNGIS